MLSLKHYSGPVDPKFKIFFSPVNPIGPGGGCVTPPQSTYFLIRTFIQNKIIWKLNDFS
jgi:hypothetical protein